MLRTLNLLRTCNDARALSQILSGFYGDSHIVSKFVAFNARRSSLSHARDLLDKSSTRSLYWWNQVLKRSYEDGEWEETLCLFRQMLSRGTSDDENPDSFTLPVVLRACGRLRDIRYGNMVHGFVKKSGKIGLDVFIGSALIDMYFKCVRIVDASRVFEEFSKPDVVMWTSMVSGYEKNGYPDKAVEVFTNMVMVENVKIDPVTLVSLGSACKQLLNSKLGKCLHGFVIRKSLDFDLSLVNSLLDLYVKTGSVKSAMNLFRKMKKKNVVSWGSMIACYARNGDTDEVLGAFYEMMDSAIEPNSVTIVSALQACSVSCELDGGRRIHELALKKGLETEVTVSTALVDMYMKCSSPDQALEVFSRTPKKDVVSWIALISGFAQNGMAHKSMEVFRTMLLGGTQPEAIVMVKVLASCSELGVFRQAICLHGYVIRSSFDKNPFVGASLVEFYSKCGSLDNAVRVFESIETKDVVVWSSMISGYGVHGQGQEAISIFNRMLKDSETKANRVTFLSILSACSHAGLVRDGIEIFNSMADDHKLVPDSEHYAILVDLLGRTGCLDRATDIVKSMPVPPGPHVWGALLGACRIHRNIEVAETAAENLLRLGSDHAGYYILLSNMYGIEGEWLNMEKVRKFVKEKRMKKVLAESSVELGGKVHSFVADDRLHGECEVVYEVLRQLRLQMQEEVWRCNVGRS